MREVANDGDLSVCNLLLSKVQDFEGHPVRTIGYVAATVIAAVVAIWILV